MLRWLLLVPLVTSYIAVYCDVVVIAGFSEVEFLLCMSMLSGALLEERFKVPLKGVGSWLLLCEIKLEEV